MLNLSAVSRTSLAGRTLRLPLRLVPDGMPLRILQRPLRGQCWISGASTHGCWLGSYEREKQRDMLTAVKPGMVCYDIGATVGFYTLLLSKLAQSSGRVFAFDPLP